MCDYSDMGILLISRLRYVLLNLGKEISPLIIVYMNILSLFFLECVLGGGGP